MLRRLSNAANTVSDAARIFPAGRLPPLGTSSKTDPVEVPDQIKTAAEKQEKVAPIVSAPRIVFTQGHIKPISAITVLKANFLKSSDGKDVAPIIVSGGEDKCINFWSVETCSLIMSLNGHAARISGLVLCNPGGGEPLLVSSSWDEHMRVWPVGKIYSIINGSKKRDDVEADIQQRCSVIKGHKNRISDVDCIEYSALSEGSELLCPNQSLVVTGSCDNTFRVYTVQMNGDEVIVDFKFKVFDLTTTWWLAMKLHVSQIYGPLIVSGGKDHTLRIWKLDRPVDTSGILIVYIIPTIRDHDTTMLC